VVEHKVHFFAFDLPHSHALLQHVVLDDEKVAHPRERLARGRVDISGTPVTRTGRAIGRPLEIFCSILA
jgi:hypothetical protein